MLEDKWVVLKNNVGGRPRNSVILLRAYRAVLKKECFNGTFSCSFFFLVFGANLYVRN